MIRIDLRRLILWISLLSIFLVLAAGLHASYLVQRDLLLHNALESNRVYAAKLAATTEYFLGDLRRHLAYSADTTKLELKWPSCSSRRRVSNDISSGWGSRSASMSAL